MLYEFLNLKSNKKGYSGTALVQEPEGKIPEHIFHPTQYAPPMKIEFFENDAALSAPHLQLHGVSNSKTADDEEAEAEGRSRG